MPSNRIPHVPPIVARTERSHQSDDALGLALRQMFDDVLDEEIPSSFLTLLDEICQRSSSDGDASDTA